MPDYQTPGVYVNENSFEHTVIPNQTAVPVFIGFTQKALLPNGKSVGYIKGSNLVREPVLISTQNEYEKYFGKTDTTGTFQISENGSNAFELAIVRKDQDKIANYIPGFMHPGIMAYFQNGGKACYIISLGTYEDFAGSNPAMVKMEELEEAIKLAESATLIVPSDLLRFGPASYYSWITRLTNFCKAEKTIFCIADVIQQDPHNTSLDPADITTYRSEVNPNAPSYVAAYYPYLKSSTSYAYDEDKVNYQEQPLAKADHNEILAIKTFLATQSIYLPPSYVMAGIYCKVDSTEGVWKAPANVALLGIGEPSVSITDLQQESLNVDAISGKSINAIRKFYGRGILPWGARTNAGNDGEWKYIPVRRLAIAIETDINLGLKPFVFKPNVHNTWVEIKAMIESYLSGLFRQGALMGNTLDHACQVRIGLGITMTDQDILDGNLKFDVLFAPLRPAEFIILHFKLLVLKQL